MLEWGEFCLQELDREKRISISAALFGSYDVPQFSGERNGRVLCQACNDDGLVYSEACTPWKHNHHKRSAPGWITCECAAGSARNQALSTLGRAKQKEPRKSAFGDF